MEKIAMIPAAGKGSRLGLPFSKELLPLLGDNSYIPIIKNSIDALIKINITQVVFIINSNKSDLIKYLGNGQKWGMNFSYVIQEEPSSLPEALNEAYHLIKGKIVYFLMPDTLIEPNDFLVDFEKNSKEYEVLLGCFKTKRPDKFAMCDFDHDEVIFLEEKNKESKLNWMWGFWKWHPSFTEKLKNHTFISKHLRKKEPTLSEVLDDWLGKKKVGHVKLYKYNYRDLGTFDEIKEYVGEFSHLKSAI